MSDMHAVSGGASPELDRLVDDLKAEIALGHVGDDVSSVLRQRIADAGLTVPDEEIETIASDIEVESSR